jgi:hypothetical protein
MLGSQEIKTVSEEDGRQVFAVVSWGCAATNWTARALNAHPDVFCMHAANRAWKKFGNAPLSDGVDYLGILLRQAHGYAAIGDIHGIDRDQIAEARLRFGTRFEAAVLIREPLARLRSQLILFERNQYKSWGDLLYVDSLIEPAGIDPRSLTVEKRHFIHAVNMLNSILFESHVGPVFRSEDLTTSPDHLIEFAAHLTRRKIVPSLAWAEAMIELPRVAVRVGKGSEREFSEFEKRVLAAVVRPEAWTEYEKHGYSIKLDL